MLVIISMFQRTRTMKGLCMLCLFFPFSPPKCVSPRASLAFLLLKEKRRRKYSRDMKNIQTCLNGTPLGWRIKGADVIFKWSIQNSVNKGASYDYCVGNFIVSWYGEGTRSRAELVWPCQSNKSSEGNELLRRNFKPKNKTFHSGRKILLVV